jgi:uncharacterized protein (TIGR03437 family)
VIINQIPAPMIYGSPNQVTVLVPYEIKGGVARIQVLSGGASSQIWSVPIAPTAPAIFTADASGVGPAAVIQSGNLLSIYATGEGETSPPGETGSVIGTNLKRPLAKVSVTIGGNDAQVLYAGSAGNSVSGLLQINALIPDGVKGVVPLSIKIGDAVSQPGVTVAIQ